MFPVCSISSVVTHVFPVCSISSVVTHVFPVCSISSVVTHVFPVCSISSVVTHVFPVCSISSVMLSIYAKLPSHVLAERERESKPLGTVFTLARLKVGPTIKKLYHIQYQCAHELFP